MKKAIPTLLLSLLPVYTWAEPVTQEAALQKAEVFLSQKKHGGRHRVRPNSSAMKLLYAKCQTPADTPLLYVFGNEDDGGYVVVAGDDAAAVPVLGYSLSRKFDADSIPCGLASLLDEYGRQLAYARVRPRAAAVSSEAPKAAIAPLLSSKWRQDAPFNNFSPMVGANHCAAGCAATAMGQLMYYYKWPKQGVGSNSYSWSDQILSADFASTTYQWDKMKDTYDSDTEDADDAVATLMYHCGVAVNMMYSSSGSGAYMSKVIQALKKYFSYSVVENRGDGGIYAELAAGCPVLVEGANSSSSWDTSGHAFICDGYQDGYYHFNFGWGGNWDDYYLLSAINPDHNNYSNSIRYYSGIRKSGFSFDGCNYCISPDGTSTLMRGTVSGDFAIPASIKIDDRDYMVTAIEDSAFYGCKDLISLTIPAGVTSIGNVAFKDCSGLKSIEIPEGVAVIGDGAFNYCKELTSVVLPSSVTTIGTGAFFNCLSLSSITIPETVTSVGSSAFLQCI